MEGSSHPDRNAHFEFINARCTEEKAAGDPVISVDTKQKELVGDFKNGGHEYQPKGMPEPVRVHDFKIPELGRADPYGIYDLKHNVGRVDVGSDHLCRGVAPPMVEWAKLHPRAQRLRVVADGEGSNGTRAGFGRWSCKGWPKT